jgi:hypothetical protein
VEESDVQVDNVKIPRSCILGLWRGLMFMPTISDLQESKQTARPSLAAALPKLQEWERL